MEENKAIKTNEGLPSNEENNDSKSGVDMDEILLLSAKQAEARVTKQVKKQKFIAGIVVLEGAIALIAGIAVLALSSLLAVGIPLILIGAFIAVSVIILNARTIKKLKLMLERAKGIQKQIAEGKFEKKSAQGEEKKTEK